MLVALHIISHVTPTSNASAVRRAKNYLRSKLCQDKLDALQFYYSKSHPSVVCYVVAVRLSSVTLLPPTQKIEIFDNIFAPSNSSGTWAFCVKIFGKKYLKGFLLLGDGAIYGTGIKSGIFQPISCFISTIVTTEEE